MLDDFLNGLRCLGSGIRLVDARHVNEERPRRVDVEGLEVNVAAQIFSNITRGLEHRTVRLVQHFHNFIDAEGGLQAAALPSVLQTQHRVGEGLPSEVLQAEAIYGTFFEFYLISGSVNA